jgi:hypothetical protein
MGCFGLIVEIEQAVPSSKMVSHHTDQFMGGVARNVKPLSRHIGTLGIIPWEFTLLYEVSNVYHRSRRSPRQGIGIVPRTASAA